MQSSNNDASGLHLLAFVTFACAVGGVRIVLVIICKQVHIFILSFKFFIGFALLGACHVDISQYLSECPC
jgi:hypothetical protein